MKAKLLVSTAFLAASVSLSAQKSATITVHADQGKEILKGHSIFHICKKYVRRCNKTSASQLVLTFVHGLFKITALSPKKEGHIFRPLFPKTGSGRIRESI